jgi:cyanobactin biosynthesis protein (PatB/AcyB/McaB family)
MSPVPIQAPPVRRPELVEPHRTVDVVHGTPDQLVAMRMRLTHGANFNDPAPFAWPTTQRMRASAWYAYA